MHCSLHLLRKSYTFSRHSRISSNAHSKTVSVIRSEVTKYIYLEDFNSRLRSEYSENFFITDYDTFVYTRLSRLRKLT